MGVGDGVIVGVPVIVGDGVIVGVRVGVLVGVKVGVFVGVLISCLNSFERLSLLIPH